MRFATLMFLLTAALGCKEGGNKSTDPNRKVQEGDRSGQSTDQTAPAGGGTMSPSNPGTTTGPTGSDLTNQQHGGTAGGATGGTVGGAGGAQTGADTTGQGAGQGTTGTGAGMDTTNRGTTGTGGTDTTGTGADTTDSTGQGQTGTRTPRGTGTNRRPTTNDMRQVPGDAGVDQQQQQQQQPGTTTP